MAELVCQKQTETLRPEKGPHNRANTEALPLVFTYLPCAKGFCTVVERIHFTDRCNIKIPVSFYIHFVMPRCESHVSLHQTDPWLLCRELWKLEIVIPWYLSIGNSVRRAKSQISTTEMVLIVRHTFICDIWLLFFVILKILVRLGLLLVWCDFGQKFAQHKYSNTSGNASSEHTQHALLCTSGGNKTQASKTGIFRWHTGTSILRGFKLLCSLDCVAPFLALRSQSASDKLVPPMCWRVFKDKRVFTCSDGHSFLTQKGKESGD